MRHLRGVTAIVESGKIKGEYLSGVYSDIATLLGIDAALKLHANYKGQQLFFPMELFSKEFIKSQIVEEYNGYNIKQLNDMVVQPNGTVTVKIKVPENLTGDKFYVYRIESDGSYTDMKAEYSDGYITFKTSHFSEYIISTQSLTESAETVTTTDVVTETATTTSSDITTSIEITTINTDNVDNTNNDINVPTGNVYSVFVPIIAFASGITAVVAYNKMK